MDRPVPLAVGVPVSARTLADLSAAVRDASSDLPLIQRLALEKTGEDARALARWNAAGGVLQRRSGNLERSVDYRVEGGAVLVLESDSPYAGAHEFGARIHGRPWLTFKIGGQWARVRQVRIPRRPWLRPALEAAAENLPARIDEQLRPRLEVR